MIVLLGDENEPNRKNFSEKELKEIDAIKEENKHVDKSMNQVKKEWDQIGNLEEVEEQKEPNIKCKKGHDLFFC